jgi:DinB superfamily
MVWLFTTVVYGPYCLGSMGDSLPADLQHVSEALDAAERDARAIVAGLTEARAAWREQPGSWSVAECLDHLGTANRVYLRAMQPAAARALREGRRRLGPARPGLVGGWFVKLLEPPVTVKSKAPRLIRPRTAPALDDAIAAFLASQEEVRTFLRTYADIDLTGVRFPNPFIRGVRFSLATGLHVLAAHERRHLWQARRVRQAAERVPSTG